MAQLPAKQHALLYELDKIKADYKEHSEKILSKLVSIIGGIVEHSLAPRIAHTDFDARAKTVSLSSDKVASPSDTTNVDCCLFLDNVVTNTRKMHQVLHVMLPAELLRDVFSRIFAYLDHKVPSLFKTAGATTNTTSLEQQKIFMMPTTDDGKLQMIKEVEYMARTMNGLPGVEPWNFTAMKILEQELDITRDSPSSSPSSAVGQEAQPQLLPVSVEEEVGGPSKPDEDVPDPEKEAEMTKDDQPEAGSAKSAVSTTEEDNLNDERNTCPTSKDGPDSDSGPAEGAKIENGVDDGDSSGNTLEASPDENPSITQDKENEGCVGDATSSETVDA